MPAETRKMRNERVKEERDPHFRLFDLPPELQIRIHEFAVCEADDIVITEGETAGTNVNGGITDDNSVGEEEGTIQGALISPYAQPAITRTCRSIRVDALKYYYTRNVFTASYCDTENERGPEDSVLLSEWLRCIGARNRSLIGTLEVYDYGFASERKGVEEEESAMASLRRSPAINFKVSRLRYGVHLITFPKLELGG
ncbi:hypothetical protein LTS10_007181 [Elasticomyces elasticus]|nr:hypothetical protein LTS10_007181 [Elasticomyces elasticus]